MKTVHRKPTHIAKLNGAKLRVAEGDYVMATGKSFKACVKIGQRYDLELLEKGVFSANIKWQALTEKKFGALKKKPEVLNSAQLIQKHGNFVQTKSTLKVGDIIDALSELDRDTAISVATDGDWPREVDWLHILSRGDEQILLFEVNSAAGTVIQDEVDFDEEDLPEGYSKKTIASVWEEI